MNVTEYRKMLGSFMTGVTVVSTLDEDGAPWGVTANSFTSVSLAPPVVLVCIGKAGRTYPTFAASDGFAVNILAAHQQELATHFAGRTENRFETVEWTRNHGGSPLLMETSGWLDCRVHNRIDAGSHEILMGEVLYFGRNDSTPLGFCHGRFVSPHPLNEILNEMQNV